MLRKRSQHNLSIEPPQSARETGLWGCPDLADRFDCSNQVDALASNYDERHVVEVRAHPTQPVRCSDTGGERTALSEMVAALAAPAPVAKCATFAALAPRTASATHRDIAVWLVDVIVCLLSVHTPASSRARPPPGSMRTSRLGSITTGGDTSPLKMSATSRKTPFGSRAAAPKPIAIRPIATLRRTRTLACLNERTESRALTTLNPFRKKASPDMRRDKTSRQSASKNGK